MVKVLAAVLVACGLTAGVVMASVEDQIRERISPVGDVCLQGEDCGSAAPSAATAGSDGPRAGDEVYAAACQACHANGVAGAPVTGDQDAWSPRIDKGMETLISHAINGFNAMPAKGGCGSCSDEEIEAAVQYMVDEVQ
ncbi:c-type cytochrome [Marinobacter daqiaonensis]|uniref:c-type cytochrome n=1 Tax=Marinobacter daqiaonensis TaxID=650891 RepID=UPI000B81F4C5|nr:c-type cytochrome [Marinobacter daqiaonensis]